MSHYHIASPHYPNYYPNEDMECMYLIDPKGEHEKSVVILKVQDFDLSPVKSKNRTNLKLSILQLNMDGTPVNLIMLK